MRDLIFGFLSLFVAWRGIVGFVSCVGLSLILLSLAPSQKVRFFETATSSVLFPVQFVISSIASHRDLRDENERLKLENAQLRARVDKLFQMGLENRRIREMLKMDSIAEYPNVVGTILARDLGFEGSSCLMDVGEEDNVAMDMPVYTMRGLVGRVSRVARDHSEIQLLNSTSSRVGVMNNRSRVQSVLEPGVGGDLQMGYFHNADMKVGDEVVTSGLGGVFPKGMAVGRIVGFRKDPMRMLAQAIVRPHQDLHSFEEAMIMLKQDQRVLIGKGYANVGTTDTLR